MACFDRFYVIFSILFCRHRVCDYFLVYRPISNTQYGCYVLNTFYRMTHVLLFLHFTWIYVCFSVLFRSRVYCNFLFLYQDWIFFYFKKFEKKHFFFFFHVFCLLFCIVLLKRIKKKKSFNKQFLLLKWVLCIFTCSLITILYFFLQVYPVQTI